MDIKVGDVVVLKSGSMKMTVVWIGTEGLVEVAWWTGSGISKWKFPPEALVLKNGEEEAGK